MYSDLLQKKIIYYITAMHFFFRIYLHKNKNVKSAIRQQI